MEMHRWANVEFPLPFGRTMSPAEEKIHRMDEKVYQPCCSPQPDSLDLFDISGRYMR